MLGLPLLCQSGSRHHHRYSDESNLTSYVLTLCHISKIFVVCENKAGKAVADIPAPILILTNLKLLHHEKVLLTFLLFKLFIERDNHAAVGWNLTEDVNTSTNHNLYILCIDTHLQQFLDDGVCTLCA